MLITPTHARPVLPSVSSRSDRTVVFAQMQGAIVRGATPGRWGSDAEVVGVKKARGASGWANVLRASCISHRTFLREIVCHKGSVPVPNPFVAKPPADGCCQAWGAYRALCEKLAVLHHREFGKFRRLKGRH